VLNDLESRHIKPLPEPGAIDFLSLDSLKKVVIFCLDILPHYLFKSSHDFTFAVSG